MNNTLDKNLRVGEDKTWSRLGDFNQLIPKARVYKESVSADRSQPLRQCRTEDKWNWDKA